jgi:arylsulfatase
MLPYSPSKGMFTIMKVRHEAWKEKYPDKEQARSTPLTGIENARPETKAASQSQVDPEKLPFKPQGFIKNLPGWENLDDKWGS